MLPVIFFKIRSAALTLIFIVLLQSCIQDDLSNCGIGVRYRFVKNVEGIDKFSTSINEISLFVFDENKHFLGKYTESTAHMYDQTMLLPLKKGKYFLVAWGGLSDDYNLTSCVVGKTIMEDFLLSLKSDQGIVNTHPADLYYGGIEEIEIKEPYTGTKYITIDMMKNTNTIHVVTSGLPFGINSNSTHNSSYECKITSVNEAYKIDNSIVGKRLTYLPYEKIENKELFSDFVVMRELNNGSTESNIIISETTSGGFAPKELLKIKLTDLLIEASITKDLDIDDDFKINILFDENSGHFKISIKDWVVVVNDGGNIIG
ncbi:hypothetical protein M2459_000433 [Parabacteroides sp. PF5-5]|uniref:FimB/Mfa2 family fimbrial subunit n=1 Tax=unclassified Parabacteroides TaxID=2649774 RepID=UPI0024734682|nr:MULTISPECIES: FimB/Mfa2 family fimbrial subunit [unclassified Parabacteroides]MDH6303633.1 hypothetical protein [Parabacteroides sp. PH5-39]MDH6314955.1 hypothetical protein [Parabacteroides sp. PF5-13]MDH6318292.1 hypothetical protein [Parabacteroides sp. PH5-13]MDH6321775.1 hypothetical protein [Parabacteroides sp. PH5-8]MDH6325899.1 hypothetical protein [Parabacteroides sp. PH5-41]